MKKAKVLSCIISSVLSMNLVFSGLNVSVMADDDSYNQYSDGIDNAYVGTEHAYDPMAELEAEEAERKYRENADIEANKVLFSVITNEKGSYLSDNSDICRKYELHNVKMIYESGNDICEVFYEAETSTDDIWGLVDKLRDDECIASAEPAFVWKKSAIGEPTEVAEAEFNRASHFSLLDTENVWKSLKNSSAPGKGVVIAVIDTGVDYNHKDLADNIWTNPNEVPDNGIDDDGNGYVDDIHGVNVIYNSGDPMDDHGHGTHVAGAIAMTAGNGGGIGLAYGAQIMCIKAGSSSGTFASYDVAKAIKYAVDNGADVINMSFGGEEKASVVEAALNDAAEYAVLVASAGNDGMPTSEAAENGYKNCKDVYPAGFNTVIGVMASDNEDHLAAFSNWDYISGKGCEYEMAAPGVDIYSTLPDNRYAVWSGTSLASANVAAAAAIIRSEYPNKSKYDARFIMGQLINASSSKATAEPEVITTPVVTTATTTAVNPVTTVATTTVMSDAPLVNADVDGKEGIDKDDFAYLLKGLVGLNDLGGSKGDVNCDGTADMFDAVSVLRLCDNKDSVKDIMDSATIRKEYISFDIPSIDITADGDYTNYTIKYNSNYPFKAITGQLKYNGKAYSGEFKEVKLLDATSDDIIYEFNPENGKIAAYCAGNETSGSFTISVYEGKDGSYSIDTSSLKFYDENGKEYLGYSLGMFDPELNYHSASSTAAVGTPSAVAVYDKKVEYPRLNIMDSLTVKAHPELRIESVEMLETADIDEANNGDGIVQPGETVGLGISIWNSWAAASDVKVKIEAVGADGKANPYVEVLDSNISMSDIKAYSGADNGLTYSDGKIKSITAPVRIKVKDNAPNDGKMEFKITLAAKNGFDTDDRTVYTENGGYSFAVQRISYLRGTIKKDITLDSSRFWIIDGVTLDDGAIMTIKPGTQIQFGYEGSKNEYAGLNIEKGSLYCKGTEKCPITMSCWTGCKYASIISRPESTGYIEYLVTLNLTISLYSISCNHCKFIQDYSTNRYMSIYIPDLLVSNSIICRMNEGEHREELYIPNSERCLFDSNVISPQNGNSKYNIYLNDEGIRFDTLSNESTEIESKYPFMTEAYVTNEKGERIENAYPGQTLMVHVKFNRDMAMDIQPEVSLESGYCSHPYEYENEEDEVIDRYSVYALTGNWISSREWIGKYSFDLNVLDKRELDVFPFAGEFKGWEYFKSRFFTIRSEGAVAADDRWLVTGNDGGRFGFNVVKPATVQAYTLIGEGVSGGNLLTLAPGETKTLAGYNLYRSIGDSNNFTKLNKLLLSNEDLQYTDTDVITGQKYYYYFTSVDTDFNESKPSNTVECVPLERKKVVIKNVNVSDTKAGEDLIINADVDNDTDLNNITLYYKYDGNKTWNAVNMKNTNSSTYKALIPSDKVKEGTLEYYIEAADSFNKINYGSRSDPCIIKITSSGIISQTATTTATTTSSIITTTTTTTNVNSPKILSMIISEAKANEKIKAYADIIGNGEINAVLYYKYAEDEEWNSIAMNKVYDSTYNAVIPAYNSKPGTLQYYLEASDDNGISYYGSAAKYFKIIVINVVTTTTSMIPTTTSMTTTPTTTTTTSTTMSAVTTTALTTTTSAATTTTSTATTSAATTTTLTTTTSATTTITSTSTTSKTSTAASTSNTTTTTTVSPIILPVTAIAINNGEQYAIPITLTGIIFKSSNTDVAVVSGYGIVTAVGAGEAVISIIDMDYNVVQLKVTVKQNEISYQLGDVNSDGKINAVDASMVLTYYANISTNKDGDFDEKQKLAANVDKNDFINAVDASHILSYYAYTSTTKTDIKSFEDYMKDN